MEVIIVLLVLILAGILIYGIGSIFYDVGEFFYNKFTYMVAVAKPLSAKRKETLRKYFYYYNRLSREHQKQFEQRVNRFLHSKSFVSRELEVTDEMKVLISATAVKLTFGLPFLYLSNFHKVAIYEDSYYSRINQRYHLGEVNPHLGLIILSWKSFVSGYLDHNDNRNLGIHEMAHALHFENQIRNDEFDFLHQGLMDRWDALAAIEIQKIRNGEPHFFRDYAGTNEYEFFAVSMEYFFESPREYHEKLPELYRIKTHLLRQNPITLYGL